jgi:hypothetical protein
LKTALFDFWMHCICYFRINFLARQSSHKWQNDETWAFPRMLSGRNRKAGFCRYTRKAWQSRMSFTWQNLSSGTSSDLDDNNNTYTFIAFHPSRNHIHGNKNSRTSSRVKSKNSSYSLEIFRIILSDRINRTDEQLMAILWPIRNRSPLGTEPFSDRSLNSHHRSHHQVPPQMSSRPQMIRHLRLHSSIHCCSQQSRMHLSSWILMMTFWSTSILNPHFERMLIVLIHIYFKSAFQCYVKVLTETLISPDSIYMRGTENIRWGKSTAEGALWSSDKKRENVESAEWHIFFSKSRRRFNIAVISDVYVLILRHFSLNPIERFLIHFGSPIRSYISLWGKMNSTTSRIWIDWMLFHNSDRLHLKAMMV